MATRGSGQGLATGVVLYWDSSAIVSALLQDQHTGTALSWLARSGLHLLSTLAWAEVHAVLARGYRDRQLSRTVLESALDALESEPWRTLAAVPDWETIRGLSSNWRLRGPDLWHLALAKTLQVSEMPALRLLTFDERLGRAADGEGLAPPGGVAGAGR